MFKARLRQFYKKNIKQGFPSKNHTVNESDLQYSIFMTSVTIWVAEATLCVNNNALRE
jgi:hypothetical protein